MVHISTFVFFDLETTGLPYQERNRTKIIEMGLVAVAREDMRRIKRNQLPPTCKLTFFLNPHKTVHSTAITGIDNEILKHAPTFKEKFNTINSFLEDLKKPVCLVAHNGNVFDYKILQAECADANVSLPDHLLCADSLYGFKFLLKNQTVSDESILTDDEHEMWPQLNITPEELQEIDGLCDSLTNISCNGSPQKKAKTPASTKTNRISYKLTDIYKRLFNKEPENAHRAEDDCLMLLQCVGVCQDTTTASNDFLCWIDKYCKELNQIKPLERK